jgi:hypothetical protein
MCFELVLPSRFLGPAAEPVEPLRGKARRAATRPRLHPKCRKRDLRNDLNPYRQFRRDISGSPKACEQRGRNREIDATA